jgi:hypothetical protein
LDNTPKISPGVNWACLTLSIIVAPDYRMAFNSISQGGVKAT